MLRASFIRLLGVVALASAAIACDSARLIDTYSTTQVILRETPGFSSCTTAQVLTVDLLAHTLAYAICPASATTTATGTIAVTDQEYPNLLSVLESMRNGSSDEVVSDAGVFTAVIIDGGDTLQYVEASTASGSDLEPAKGIMTAFDTAYAIVLAHRVDGDTGASGVTI